MAINGLQEVERVVRVYVPSGALVKKYREKAGLTVESAAELARITPVQLRKIEAGQATPSSRTFGRIAGVLDVTPNDLYKSVDLRR
ncbi:MAG TPA: helix-turn-helix transcriptional regulator [Thermodesulfobacteriota bacterium]